MSLREKIESNEPSFLRKLKAEVGGHDADRHERPIARPEKAKNAADDEGPTYVVEGSNETLSKDEYDALMSKTSEANEASDQALSKDDEKPTGHAASTEAGSAAMESAPISKQILTEAGKPEKKRKAGKVVADDRDEGGEEDGVSQSKAKKPKRKAKAMKLSFGNEE